MFYMPTHCTLGRHVAGVKLYPPILLDADYLLKGLGRKWRISFSIFKFSNVIFKFKFFGGLAGVCFGGFLELTYLQMGFDWRNLTSNSKGKTKC